MENLGITKEQVDKLEKIFNFLHKVEKLKSTARYNFTSEGRKESSAEHSWRLALMVLTVSEELKLNVDINRSIKMAICHDLAEAITGDIDAVRIVDGEITKEEKQRMEISAMKNLQGTLPEDIGREIYGLWKEYEDGITQDAKLVKALDKIETITQLYEAGHKIYDRPELIPNYADKAVRNFPELINMLKIVKRKLKEEFLKGNISWKEEYDSLI